MSAPLTVATLLISASSSRRLASHPTRASVQPFVVSRAISGRRAHLQDRPGEGCRPTLGGVVFGLPCWVGRCRGRPHLSAPSPARRGGEEDGLLPRFAPERGLG